MASVGATELQLVAWCDNGKRPVYMQTVWTLNSEPDSYEAACEELQRALNGHGREFTCARCNDPSLHSWELIAKRGKEIVAQPNLRTDTDLHRAFQDSFFH